MKIGIFGIISDHILTLQNARSGKVSIIDLSTFYFFPLAASAFIYIRRIPFEKDIFGQSIAVFAIFSALLFSVQVALFGIYSKKRESVDEYGEIFAKERLSARRELVRETNANISYLIVVATISVTFFLAAFAVKMTDRFEPPVAVFLYLHFMLTLLMVLKRVHALFDKEYGLVEM